MFLFRDDVGGGEAMDKVCIIFVEVVVDYDLPSKLILAITDINFMIPHRGVKEIAAMAVDHDAWCGVMLRSITTNSVCERQKKEERDSCIIRVRRRPAGYNRSRRSFHECRRSQFHATDALDLVPRSTYAFNSKRSIWFIP